MSVSRALLVHVVVALFALVGLAAVALVMGVSGAPLTTWWRGVPLAVLLVDEVAMAPINVTATVAITREPLEHRGGAAMLLATLASLWAANGLVLASLTQSDDVVGLTSWSIAVGLIYGIGALSLFRLSPMPGPRSG